MLLHEGQTLTDATFFNNEIPDKKSVQIRPATLFDGSSWNTHCNKSGTALHRLLVSDITGILRIYNRNVLGPQRREYTLSNDMALLSLDRSV